MSDERFFIEGGARLSGEVTVSGAKNAALKFMAGALLAPGRSFRAVTICMRVLGWPRNRARTVSGAVMTNARS